MAAEKQKFIVCTKRKYTNCVKLDCLDQATKR